jgi:cysteine-rich repeat protein
MAFIHSRNATFGAALGIAFALSASACGTAGKAPDREQAENTGAIGLDLTLAKGIWLHTIDYSISNADFFMTGSFDVKNSTVLSATIGGIPEGTGYTLELSSTSVNDSNATCRGFITDVEIHQGATTSATVQLSCHLLPTTGSVKIHGSFNLCPTVESLSVEPGQTTVGSQVTLSGSGKDLDNGPGPLSYQWWASLGELADASAATTTFTCTEPGYVFIDFAVSDGDRFCWSSVRQQVICVAREYPEDPGAGGAGGEAGGDSGGSGASSPCGNGEVDPGEACDDGNVTSGDGCSANCQFDDDLSTPGDDRAGYVACTDTPNVHGLTCKPGLWCCPFTESCVTGDYADDCIDAHGAQACDGPEDCRAGLVCMRYKVTTCEAPSEGMGSARRCHTDAQCPAQKHCDATGDCVWT